MRDPVAVMPALPLPPQERERWLRHRVANAGCRLHRSRRDDGRYMIFDLEDDAIVAGHAFELSLDDVEAWIDGRNEPPRHR